MEGEAMTNEPKFAPRIVDVEPVFSGDASRPFWNAIRRVKGPTTHDVLYDYGCKAQEMEGELGRLRRQRDDLHEKNKEAIVALVAHSENETRLLNASIKACAERDAARRELCAAVARLKMETVDGMIAWRGRDEAASRGWGYLYETPEGEEG
jgi:hypothetical protein